jgi:hypothetical protein
VGTGQRCAAELLELGNRSRGCLVPLTITLTDAQLDDLAEVLADRVAGILAARRGGDALELIDDREAAELAGVSPRTIANWRSRGRLTRFGIPGRPRVSRAEVLELMAPQAPPMNRAGESRKPVGRRRRSEGHFAALARNEDTGGDR